jgi:hypothetical protein
LDLQELSLQRVQVQVQPAHYCRMPLLQMLQ